MRKPAGYWTKEKCVEIALKYKYKKDFIANDINAYCAAHRNKWIDDVCSHMIEIGNLKRRCIYAFEFEDKSVYVGLTFNVEERKYDHLWRKRSTVYKYLELKKINFVFKQLTNYILVDTAKIMEGEFVEKYRNDGWIILNITKTGGVGGNTFYWTYDKCKEEALKYLDRTSFSKNARGAFSSAYNHNWLNEICSHMIELQKPKGYWTKEKCQEEALKYNTRKEFLINSSKAYSFAYKNKYLNEICSHMIELQKPKGYWTKEKCQEEALKYNTRKEFLINSSKAYDFASRHKYLNEICSHMLHYNGKVIWTKEKCHKEALKYNKRTDFSNLSHTAYSISSRHKWLNEICSHMKKSIQLINI